MTHSIQTPADIEGMRVAGKLAAECLMMIEEHVKPGITTGELDRICHNYILNVQHAIPAPLNYRGFPKSICTSINHVVCHGIPDDDKQLKRGDIINIDVTVIKDGYHGDTSKMFKVGEVKPFADRLIRITQECMYEGIGLVNPAFVLVTLVLLFRRMLRSTFSQLSRSSADMASEKFSTKIHKCSITDDQNRASR